MTGCQPMGSSTKVKSRKTEMSILKSETITRTYEKLVEIPRVTTSKVSHQGGGIPRLLTITSLQAAEGMEAILSREEEIILHQEGVVIHILAVEVEITLGTAGVDHQAEAVILSQEEDLVPQVEEEIHSQGAVVVEATPTLLYQRELLSPTMNPI